MATLEDIAREAKAQLDSDVNLEVVAQFCSQKIATVYSASKFKALRKYGEINLKGAIGSIDASVGGTVTVTPGSNVVTGDSTAQAAWNNTLAGQFFRVFPLHTWYRIAKCDPPRLTLDSPVSTERNPSYSPGVPLAGQSYYIVQRYVPAPADARYFGVATLPYLYQPLDWQSQEQMQRRYPSRYLVGPYPWAISEMGTDWGATNKPKLLEFYPYPLIDTVICFTYWQKPPTLAFDDELPSTLDSHVVREMAMIPVMRYEYFRQLRLGNIQLAELLKSDFQNQEEKVPDLIDDALKADNGTDDMTFIQQRYQSRRSADFDPVTTAREDVWLRRG